MFVGESLHRLDCFGNFIGMTLLELLFLLLLPVCFLRICLPTLFAAVSQLFIPLTTTAISGTTNSIKLAPLCFAAATICLCKKGIAVLPITCAGAPNRPHAGDQNL